MGQRASHRLPPGTRRATSRSIATRLEARRAPGLSGTSDRIARGHVCEGASVNRARSCGPTSGEERQRSRGCGSTGQSATEKNAPLGAKCPCFDYSDCCAAGLFCSAAGQTCNVKTDTGCYTEGTCREKLKVGEQCKNSLECADPGADCLVSAGCFVSPSATIRCERSIECPDGRTCVDTYCKLISGQTCREGTDCASGDCYINNVPEKKCR